MICVLLSFTSPHIFFPIMLNFRRIYSDNTVTIQ